MKFPLKATFNKYHYWRHADSSHVVDIYLSRLMMIVASSLGGAIVSIYLIQNGYSLAFVGFYWSCYFIFRGFMSFPVMKLISLIGVMKTIVFSYCLYMFAMAFYSRVTDMGMVALPIAGVLQAISMAGYRISFYVDFSESKNSSKAGSQVAMLNIVEKLAKAVSPLIGGLIAFFFSPELSILATVGFLIIAAWPMIGKKDVEKLEFHIRDLFKHKPKVYLNSLYQIPWGFNIFANGEALRMFLAIMVFSVGTNEVYAQAGLITTIVLVVSIIATKVVGKIIDGKSGRKVITFAAIVSALTNIMRPFYPSAFMVLLINSLNEIANTSGSVAYMRGQFDDADSSKNRLLYLGLAEFWSMVGISLAALIFAILMHFFDPKLGFMAFFGIVGLSMIPTMFVHFRVYDKK